MYTTERQEYSKVLSNIATDLDIPDHIYEDATLKYEEVGEWLQDSNSALLKYEPEIYPQGSFRLGTVVKPIHKKDEYDIDLVCVLKIKKENTTQENLKVLVGNRLKQNIELREILDSSRRCWTLSYQNQFHMDILPSIPNTETPPTGILLTDTELSRWQKSNPKSYAEWFYGKMSVILGIRKKAFAESINASIEDVPDWQVKTPLQQAVQILKRHRDVFFEEDFEHRPVSIIITTLAAHAYQNQADISDALIGITANMHRFIENRDGKWWVQNPVDAGENFSDKWNEKPIRKENFFKWLDAAKRTFSEAATKQTLVEAADSLSPSLGKAEVQHITEAMGIRMRSGLPVKIGASVSVPALGNTNHVASQKWPSQISYKAGIKGIVYKTKGKKKLWEITNRPVPKNVWLKFTLITNAPPPFEVQWQIVNTGRDAEVAGGLRGDFYPSDEIGIAPVRWEQTSYKGTHWVQALVLKNGICVAKSEKKMILIR